MNSGIFCVYVAIVFAILLVSGWADRYVRESRISRSAWALVLLLIGFFSSYDVSVKAISVNVGMAAVLACSLFYMLFILSWKQKLVFLLSAATAGASTFTLMVLLPHDPAFYFIKDIYLYPISGVCAASLFSRKPLLSMASSVCGVIAAGVIFDNWFTAPFAASVSLGSQDLMELAAVAFVSSYILNTSVAVVEFIIKHFSRALHKLDGDPS